MFNKFTTLIQHAVDSFVPNLTLQEEFIHHWNAVTHYFVDNKEERRRIEETTIPGHIEQMVLILVQEEREQLEVGTTGPCLEYLLQHRLLETLYTLGRTDHPPGMKQVILIFFTKLLSRLDHPLLPHINVHRAAQRLVKICGEVRAGPTEKEEIEYLCTVCSKIKADPYLVNFFIESGKPVKNSSHVNTSGIPKSQDFSLVNALLTLSSSNDARVCVKACEGIMLCVSLPEQSAADCLVRHTKFCDNLITRLCDLYDKLPSFVSPSDIESVDAKWGLDAVVTVKEDQQTFKGKWQLTSFLAWLDYCDQLIAVSHPTVAAALATTITEKLLLNKIKKDLLQASEAGVLMATAYFTKCLRIVYSPPLLIEFSHFLLGTDKEVEKLNDEQPTIRKRLLERCDHLSDEVSVVTMRLFETLLQKEEESIFHNLILRNLLGRSYITLNPVKKNDEQVNTNSSQKDDASSCEGKTEFLSATDTQAVKDLTQKSTIKTDVCSNNLNVERDGEKMESDIGELSGEKTLDENVQDDVLRQTVSDETVKLQVPHKEVELKIIEKTETEKLLDSIVNDDSPDREIESGNSTATSTPKSYPRAEVHKIVTSFLSLLPEEAKSSYQTADSGYDMYLKDAHKQFSNVEQMCKPWNWPSEPVVDKDFSTEPFWEGSFVKMLLDKLSRTLNQSYAVNLLVTSLISRVAILPHPNIQEYLLDPFIPTDPKTRTLHNVLKKISAEVLVYMKTESDFQNKLGTARKNLMGAAETVKSLRLKPMTPPSPGFDDQGQLEAIIVLEEFCKELSAITFVKYHAAVTRT
ncbi:hypothetical protein SNE40_017875 [Patella caerulea]|uniref:FHF complex subunit HOOK-interacting protein C-terminal domain-containing protein n=1 Tax=Patella caerulea TaxID=87958 RepID=A0AAN8JBY3_PATCE